MKNIFDKQYKNLAAAYRNTIYSCFEPGLKVQIGQFSADLDKLMLARGYECVSILTAYNPGSIVRTEEENRKSQIAFKADLEEVGYEYLRGMNVDPHDTFPDEHTCWVFGMRKQIAMAQARKWKQKAFVFCHLGEKPELVWVK